MIRESDKIIINKILQAEGGFVNNPNDKGGPTNYGITAQTLGEWRHLGRDATVEEVKALTRDEAVRILGQRYIEGPGLDQIANDKLRGLIVDMWVNHGPRGATLIIQKALKLPGDGILGPKTLGELSGRTFNNYDPFAIFNTILAERWRFYSRHVKTNPTQIEFIVGWADRAADFLSPN